VLLIYIRTDDGRTYEYITIFIIKCFVPINVIMYIKMCFFLSSLRGGHGYHIPRPPSQSSLEMIADRVRIIIYYAIADRDSWWRHPNNEITIVIIFHCFFVHTDACRIETTGDRKSKVLYI